LLETLARRYGVPRAKLSREAVAALTAHDWPGNVRELRNAMERALLLSSTTELCAADIVLGASAAPRRSGGLPFPCTAHELMRAAAQSMVELCAGNKSRAARRFGVSRARLLRLLDSAVDDDAHPYAGVPPVGDSLEDDL
jgi:DNA-binding NtrC family response regulator